MGPDVSQDTQGWITLNFFASVLDSTNQISQVYEFRLKYNKEYISKTNRILPNSPDISPLKLINFMSSAHEIVSLELVGMSLIVLK